MKNKYLINGWYGHKYLMRADELHLRVMNDSEESNFNWIASATELIRICNIPDFPDDYATDIKIAILNCFSNLEGSRVDAHLEPSDEKAVQDAYNSLSSKDERCISAKKRYLWAIISAIESDFYEIPIHHGRHYFIFIRQWKLSWFSNYWGKDYIDFSELKDLLNRDFSIKLKKLEKSGVLIEEDDEFWSAIRKSNEWI